MYVTRICGSSRATDTGRWCRISQSGRASAGTDLTLIRGVLTTALRSVSGLPSAAMRALRGIRSRPDDADPTASLSSADKATVEAGAARVSSALETPEMRAFLTRFDQTFDENLRVLDERASATTAR